jgi:hypothetical protein
MYSTGNKKKYIVIMNMPVNEHFNSVHIGVEILSMSKRIMNEVMCLAHDSGIAIYYQDTDSMHIVNDKIQLLSEKFEKKYGRELIGKNMGQFHCDFAKRKVDGKEIEGEEVVSTESIFLGKKAYIDLLQYTDKVGNKNYGLHYRMKGVPQNVVEKEAKEKYSNNAMDLYSHLYDGKSIVFDLLSCGIKFKNNKNFTMTTVDQFPRELSCE